MQIEGGNEVCHHSYFVVLMSCFDLYLQMIFLRIMYLSIFPFCVHCSHRYVCPLSLYDLHLQHGQSGNDYSLLMFLAYKSISQKPTKFFHDIANKNKSRGKETPLPYNLSITKETLEPCFSINGSDPSESNHLSDKDNMFIETNQNENDEYAFVFKSNGKNNSRYDAFAESNDFEDYSIYFDLVSHISHLSIQEIFERIIASVFLLNCLEATTYFSNDNNSDSENGANEKNISIEERVMFASLLFQAYCIMFCNVHSISEVDSVETQEHSQSETNHGITRASTGIVLFPKVASMMNHSCDPNTACFYANGKIQVR